VGVIFSEEKLSRKTYTETFNECFPFYLFIGMSYAEYWEGEPSLTRYYRKAYRLKQDEINHNAWLQGLYVYDAISTALHNALRGKNTKSKNYAEKPYKLDKKDEPITEEQIEIEQEKAAAWMENFVRINSNKSQSHRARAK
jgi:hypothetical protein